MKKLLNISELSKHTEIKKRTLRRMIDDGRFPVQPIEGTKPRLWNVTAVDEWLAGRN